MVSAFIYGGKARCSSAGCWILWLLFFLLPHQSYPQSCSSSCGKIPNITHPFRLNQDPDHCGDKRYEMGCVNNVAVLKLFYGEFYVQSINYHNYTIRLVDPNIQPTNCSSLPRFILYSYNFSYNPYGDWSSWYFMNETGVLVQLNFPVIYLDCTSPPSNDAYYVDTASCINQHIYAIPEDLELGSLEPQCHVKLVTLTSYPSFDYGNVTYVDIHRALSYGFELSWLQGVCPCAPGDCYLDNITREVVCPGGSDKCSFDYDMISAACGMAKNS